MKAYYPGGRKKFPPSRSGLGGAVAGICRQTSKRGDQPLALLRIKPNLKSKRRNTARQSLKQRDAKENFNGL